MTYIFDCEVFAHDWLFVFKDVESGEYSLQECYRKIQRQGFYDVRKRKERGERKR